MTDPISAFIDHMRSCGVGPDPSVTIIDDDKIHRYRLETDKPKTQNGTYSLRVEPDGFAFGWALSFKEGITHKWHLKTSRKMTPEQRDANKRKVEDAKRKRDAETAEIAKRAAAKARRIWSQAVPGRTGYLDRKGCEALGTRVWRELLVVPMWGTGGIVGLQFIQDDGSKRFLTGSAKEGSYFAIKGDDTMVICEGFATAAAIHRATGHSVIAAFDAGNLKPVAVAMRKKYPERTIVIGADNDAWTVKPDGTPWNPGLEKAQQAAVAIGGARVIAPVADDADKLTDWDDIARRDGMDTVRDAFAAPDLPEMPDMPDHDDGWEPDYGIVEEPTSIPEVTMDIRRDIFDVIRPLGHNDGTFYFFPRAAGQIKAFTAPGLGSFQNLCTMAGWDFWEEHFGDGTATTRKVIEAASAALIATCNSLGIHDPGKVRGVGAWMDGDRALFNCGNVMVWDGGSCAPPEYKSDQVYQAGPKVVSMPGEGLSNTEAAKLLDICRSLTWRNSQHGYILAGWLVLAVVGGALRWRPHVVITGEKGSGKSTVINRIIKPILGDMALEIDGGSTEPGLRRAMGISSRPVVMDEAESESQRDRSNMEGIFMLARKSSSGAVIRNADGEYRARSCFCFAAINPRIVQGADLDRNTILELVQDRRDDAGKSYSELLLRISETITRDYSDRLLARTFLNLPTLLHNVEVFAAAMAGTQGGQRFGDQYGFLIAGAYSLTSTKRLTLEDAKAWCAKQDWSWSIQDNELSDSDRLLNAILSARAKYDDKGMTRESQIGRLLDRALNADGLDCDTAVAALGDHGIKVDRDRLTVANNCNSLSGLLRETPWSGGWRRALLGFPGAVMHDPIRFSPSVRSRAVSIPTHIVTGHGLSADDIPLEDF